MTAATGAASCSQDEGAAGKCCSAVARSLRFLLRGCLSLVVPANCRLCTLPLTEVRTYAVCDDCMQTLREASLTATCDVCGEPLAPDAMYASKFSADAESLCPECAAEGPRFVRATAHGSYDELRPAIHLMKFEGMPSLASPLGELLAAAVLAHRLKAPREMTVVPVPLFRGKRAFNQSTLLAESAIRAVRRIDPAWRLTLRPGLLRRTRRTESQFLLSPAQRRTNLRGAFAAAAGVGGIHVLLIDDVYTTGATVAECTRVLLAAGAGSVRVATLARAAKHTAAYWQPARTEARDGPRQADVFARMSISDRQALHRRERAND